MGPPKGTGWEGKESWIGFLTQHFPSLARSGRKPRRTQLGRGSLPFLRLRAILHITPNFASPLSQASATSRGLSPAVPSSGPFSLPGSQTLRPARSQTPESLCSSSSASSSPGSPFPSSSLRISGLSGLLFAAEKPLVQRGPASPRAAQWQQRARLREGGRGLEGEQPVLPAGLRECGRGPGVWGATNPPSPESGLQDGPAHGWSSSREPGERRKGAQEAATRPVWVPLPSERGEERSRETGSSWGVGRLGRSGEHPGVTPAG